MFQLLPHEDPSGVSGVGRVAVGVVFPSGKVVLEWLGSYSTFGIYDDLGQSNTFTATAARLESFSLTGCGKTWIGRDFCVAKEFSIGYES